MPPPSRKTTASDVALEAGVSKWTVARAFTPGASISPESRERVMAVAERLDYRPNLLARSLSTKRTQQIAVLIDDFSNPHKLPTLDVLTSVFQSHNLMTMLINISEHADYTDAFMRADQRQVDAIVLFGTAFREQSLTALSRGSGPPIYVLARDCKIPGVSSVACNTAASMVEIVDHLVERGYRRPGFMSGPQPQDTLVWRLEQHAIQWRRHGITQIPELPVSHYDLFAARQALRTYLQNTPASERIDVLVCENDALAMGAMDAAKNEFGLRVPQDLAFVGYDGIELAGLSSFQLTTYEQPFRAMVDTLVNLIDSDSGPQTLTLPGRLVVRQST